MAAHRKRSRTYETRDVIVAFAKHGVATDTMARALTTLPATVEGICNRAFENGELSALPSKSPADVRNAMQTELIHLREKVVELQSQVRELRGVEPGSAEDFVTVAKLTPSEACIVSQLCKHGRATKARLYAALYDSRPNPDDTPEPKIIDVLVCKIRKKIAPYGLSITTVWAWGYEITPEDVSALLGLAAARNAPVVPALAPAMADMVPSPP